MAHRRDGRAFALVLLAVAVLIFAMSLQGFDIKDAGWHLTSQRTILRHDVKAPSLCAFYLLSAVAGATWLRLTTENSLLIARLGGALLLLLDLSLVYFLLRRLFPEERVIGKALTSLALCTAITFSTSV